MAKAKKSAAARKKSSRRGKASVKPTRKKAVKPAARKKSSRRSKANVKSARKAATERAAPKKAKSKARRRNKVATKPETEVKRVPDVVEARQVIAEVPVETPIITAIEKPTGVLVVEEYQEEKQAPEAAETGQVAEAPVETTIIKAIEEPAPDVVVVEEHQSVRTATPDGEHGRGERIDPAGCVDIGPDLGDQPEQKVA